MKNVGIDIVEVARIKKLYSDTFVNYLLSDEEKEILKRYSGERIYQFIAGRFAAKEAIIKALAGEEKLERKEISLINHEDLSPSIKLKDYQLLISISHESNYAVAIAICL